MDVVGLLCVRKDVEVLDRAGHTLHTADSHGIEVADNEVRPDAEFFQVLIAGVGCDQEVARPLFHRLPGGVLRRLFHRLADGIVR